MAWVGSTHNGVYHWVFRCLFLSCQRSTFQIQCDGVAEKFDMGQFFRGSHHEHITILIVTARAHGLKEILHSYPDLSFDPADCLL